MRNFLYILFLFLSVSACKPGIPKEIIQPEKMAKVLADIHVVDGYISSIPDGDSARRVAASFYNGIYKKYGVDSVVYLKSMAYYNTNPKVMNEIYSDVVADLSRQKEVIVKKDSLTNAVLIKKTLLKRQADSLMKANPDYKVRFVLKDTTKHVIDYIQGRMRYQEPK